MPLFTAAGVFIAGAIFGGSALAAAVIGTVLAAGALYAITKLLAPDQSRPDTRRTGPAVAVDAARWVLGTARTAGSRKFYQETNGGEVFWLAHAISEGKCNNINKIWVNGVQVLFTRNGNHLDCGMSVPVPSPAEGGDNPTNFENKLDVYQYFEADGNDGAEIRAACSDWTDDHRMIGISWVAIRLRQPDYEDADGRFWHNVPEIQFEVEGIQTTWPGQPTLTWTDNAAALRYWLETVRKGIPAMVVDTASFAAAFTVCDASVTFQLPPEYAGFTGTFKRYTVNGIVTSGHSVVDVASEMDQAWQGNIAEAGGVLHFNAGADRVVRYNLSEVDTISMGSIHTGPAIQERVNALTMTLNQSKDHSYLPYDLPEIRDIDAFARDGSQHFPLDTGERLFVDAPVRAAWLAYIGLRDARGSMRFPVTLRPGTAAAPFAYMGILPGQWIMYSNGEHGLVDKLFQVSARTIHENFTVTLVLEEQFRGNYAENLILPPLKPRDIRINGGRTVPEFADLALDEIAEVQGDGTVIVYLYVTWTSTAYRTEVQMRVEGTTDVQNAETRFLQVGFPGVRVGETYEIRARHANRDDAVGPWTRWTARRIGGDVMPPALPTGMTVEALPGGHITKWEPATEDDYLHTEVWQNITADFVTATKIAEIDASEWSQVGFRTQQMVYVWVRHIDRSKNLGGTATASVETGVHPVDYEDPGGMYTNSGRNVICYWEGDQSVTTVPATLSLMNRLIGKTLEVTIRSALGVHATSSYCSLGSIGTTFQGRVMLGFAWHGGAANLFLHTNAGKTALIATKAAGDDFSLVCILGLRSPQETDTPIPDVPRRPPRTFDVTTCASGASVSSVGGMLNIDFPVPSDIVGGAFESGLLSGITSMVLGGPLAPSGLQGVLGFDIGSSFLPEVAGTVRAELSVGGLRVPLLGPGDGGLLTPPSPGQYSIANAGSAVLAAVLAYSGGSSRVCLSLQGSIPVVAEAPDLSITDIVSIGENETATFEATLSGGTYDTVEYSWEIVSGGGTLTEAT